jgi:cell division protein FtsA
LSYCVKREDDLAGEIVLGLDIGTTKVAAVIGERRENGKLEITGVGTSLSTGMRKGVVVNIEATLRAVSEAVEAAEVMSGHEVTSCWTGIGGNHIDGINSKGVVAVTGRGRELREISQTDVDRVIEAAKAVVIPMDRQILEVIPQSFIVDHQSGIRNPLDMIGVRLEVQVHIITCSLTSAQNLIRCVNRAGFKVDGLIHKGIAAGRAVLTAEEKELGTALVDLGGGTTDIIVYIQGAPYSTSTIPIGGAQVTGDISIVKNLPFETAEKVKREAGCCWEPLLEESESIIVPGMGGRPPIPIPRIHLEQIIEPRMAEILTKVKEELEKQGFLGQLGGGVVLTGGASQISGSADLANRILNLPVRVGAPLMMGGLVNEYMSPAFSTAVGLVLEGDEKSGGKERENESDRAHAKSPPKVFSMVGKAVSWVKNEFF